MGDNELTSLPLWPHGLPGTLSPSENKRTGWSRSAHTPIKRISEHRDTISCHPYLTLLPCIVPKTALPLWRKVCEKREVDIKSRYKWWINEEFHRWSFDKPLQIVYHWYFKYLLTQTFFLVIAQWRFHSTWSTISFPKIRRKKNINWNLFPHFDAI